MTTRMRLLLRSGLIGTTMLVLASVTTAFGTAPARGSSLADTGPDKPNDATQSRLRVNQCVAGAPQVDEYVNGQQAVNGGIPQTLRETETNGYLYLAPGAYSVALVPTGQGPDHPFLGPVSVQLAAGHRYTLVALGQKEDPTHKALVIDEKAAYQAIGAEPPDKQHSAHIAVNNIKGAPSIRFSLGGVAEEHSAAYGDFEASLWPLVAQSIDVVTAHSPSEVIAHADGPFYNVPGMDSIDCVFGTYPGTNDSHTTQNTSILAPGDFLQRFNDLNASAGGPFPTFHTFLSVLQKSGLNQMLASGDPYMLFAPTDAAFAALPREKLNALLADPKAMGELVRSHLVQGYYPVSSLSQHFATGAFDRTVTNMLGTRLVLTGSDQLIVNGDPVTDGGNWAMVANGTRVFWVDKLFLPSTQPTTAAGTSTALPASSSTSVPSVGTMPTTGAGAQTWTPAAVLLGIFGAFVLLLGGGFLLRRVVH